MRNFALFFVIFIASNYSFASLHGCPVYGSSANDENYARISKKYISANKAAELVADPSFRTDLLEDNNDCGNIAWYQMRMLRGLLTMYEATKDTKYLADFTYLADKIYAVNDIFTHKKDALRNRVVFGWSSIKYSAYGDRHVHGVQSGIISEIYAKFTKIVLKHKLNEYEEKASLYLKIAKRTLDEVKEDWSPGIGFYKFKKGAHNKYKIYPYNQGLALGSAYLELYEVYQLQKDKKLAEKMLKMATKIGTYFKKSVTLDKTHERYLWKYAPGSYYEDASHASIDLHFVVKAHANDILFTSNDMQLFANTLYQAFNSRTGIFGRYIDGKNIPRYTNWHSLSCLPLLDFATFTKKDLVNKCQEATSLIINNENVLKRLPLQYMVHLLDGLPKLYQQLNKKRKSIIAPWRLLKTHKRWHK